MTSLLQFASFVLYAMYGVFLYAAHQADLSTGWFLVGTIVLVGSAIMSWHVAARENRKELAKLIAQAQRDA